MWALAVAKLAQSCTCGKELPQVYLPCPGAIFSEALYYQTLNEPQALAQAHRKEYQMRHLTALVFLSLGLTGCQQAYYATMEKFGVEKREILVDRVKDARDAQVEGQQHFKDALDELSQLLKFHGGDLQTKYEELDAEYQQSVEAAQLVSSRINKVESVADALFDEWRDELAQYQNAALKAQSKQKLVTTEKQFELLLKKMRSAEKKMQPVLKIMHDNVLFLKHNLNAKAIGSIQTDFAGLQQNVSSLISEMNKAIADSNAFIAQMQSAD